MFMYTIHIRNTRTGEKMLLEEKIKIYRKRKGMSQSELAKKIGITPVHLSRLENGKFKPSIDVLRKISDNLQIDIEHLLNEEENKIPDVKIKDLSLMERLKLIESLDPKDKEVIIHIIDSFLTKKRIVNILQQEFPSKVTNP